MAASNRAWGNAWGNTKLRVLFEDADRSVQFPAAAVASSATGVQHAPHPQPHCPRAAGEAALLVVVSERELDVVEGRVALTWGLSGG